LFYLLLYFSALPSLLLSTFVKKVNGVITPTASHSSGALGAERGFPHSCLVQSPAGLVSNKRRVVMPGSRRYAPTSPLIIRISTGVGKMGHG